MAQVCGVVRRYPADIDFDLVPAGLECFDLLGKCVIESHKSPVRYPFTAGCMVSERIPNNFTLKPGQDSWTKDCGVC